MHLSSDLMARDKSFRTNVVLLSSVLLILTIISGCAVERNVKDNRFYSSYPKTIIDVDRKFNYIGAGKYETSGALNMEHDFFVFSGKTDKQVIQKGIIIEVGIIRSKYYPNMQYFFKMDDKQKNIFGHGYKVIDGKEFEYGTMCTSASSPMSWTSRLGKHEGGDETGKWLNNKGYMLPRCGLHQLIIELGTDSHKFITYFEDATLSGIECSKWYDKDQFTEKQKIYIDEFTARADQTVKFIDF